MRGTKDFAVTVNNFRDARVELINGTSYTCAERRPLCPMEVRLSDPVTITVGAEAIPVPMNPSLTALHSVWPHVRGMMEATDLVNQSWCAAHVVGLAFKHSGRSDLDPMIIMKETRGVAGMNAVLQAALEIMYSSGLYTRPGEAEPPAADAQPAESLSTETSPA